jgi:uncharacterized protein (TIGR02444 family)
MRTLWDFATKLYASSGVASACLDFQERDGIDVNQLLFAAWTGYVLGVRMDKAQFERAAQHVHGWRMQVVKPLRAIRQQLKQGELPAFHPSAMELRERVKELELRAEKLQLESLEGWALKNLVPAAAGSAACAVANVRDFLATQSSPPIAPEAAQVGWLASALALHEGRQGRSST